MQWNHFRVKQNCSSMETRMFYFLPISIKDSTIADPMTHKWKRQRSLYWFKIKACTFGVFCMHISDALKIQAWDLIQFCWTWAAKYLTMVFDLRFSFFTASYLAVAFWMTKIVCVKFWMCKTKHWFSGRMNLWKLNPSWLNQFSLISFVISRQLFWKSWKIPLNQLFWINWLCTCFQATDILLPKPMVSTYLFTPLISIYK